jgi:hypothetical protein
MGGAKKWGEACIKFQPNWFGVHFFARPIVLKISMTLFLLGTLGGVYSIILNKIKNF